MTVETLPPPTEGASKLAVDPVLLDAVIGGTQTGLEMAELCPPAVGASRFFTPRNPLSVIVGLVGRSSGSLTLNLSESGMLHMVNKFMATDYTEIDEESLDGIMELGNMIAGSLKTTLANSDHHVDYISLPSVIFGQSYQVLYSKGISTVCVEFELEEMPFSVLNDRFFSATVSLLRGAGASG
jgi:CheY-specific phosphatase CheX